MSTDDRPQKGVAAEGKAEGRALPVLKAASASGMDRRQALKVMAIAAAAPTLSTCAPAEQGADRADVPAPINNPKATGTAWDPDLIAGGIPWERVLSVDELESLRVLCDVIIPADGRSPSASAVGAHDFIDEWVSAPYDGNERDLIVVRGGLAWLDRESAGRFGVEVRFRDLAPEQHRAICDDICFARDAADGYEAAAAFFDKVRDLTSTAFWTTAEGMSDLEYIGNVPLVQWDPPPPEVLRHIGLE